jgi:7-cyano-7-deazaguanine synthase
MHKKLRRQTLSGRPLYFCGFLSLFVAKSYCMKVVVLCSGGMDSVTALHWARKHHSVAAVLSFDYGAKHNHREIPFAARQSKLAGAPHTVIPLDFIGDYFKSDLLKSGGEIPEGHYADDNMKRTVVPFRNGIMIAVAGGFAESCGADGLVIAAHSGDHAIYPDCREDFMRAIGDALRCGTYASVQLLRPFIEMNKAQIAAEGSSLGVDFAQTWSCYKGGAVHCGKCGTCVERREAFQQAGVPDPTKYESTPPLPPQPSAVSNQLSAKQGKAES